MKSLLCSVLIFLFLTSICLTLRDYSRNQRLKELSQRFDLVNETCRIMETNAVTADRIVTEALAAAVTSQEVALEAILQRDECTRMKAK